MSKRRTPSTKKSITEDNIDNGIDIINRHTLFMELDGYIRISDKEALGKASYAIVNKDGYIHLNKNILLAPDQWAYVIAHNKLHLAFGHFDKDKLPILDSGFQKHLWNIACDIYIAKFLADMKFGRAICRNTLTSFPGSLAHEHKIYDYLATHKILDSMLLYGTSAVGSMDMIGLDNPIEYKVGTFNKSIEVFSHALAYSVSNAVSIAGGHSILDEKHKTVSNEAANWFISHYPLLGGLAAGFKIIEDYTVCQKYDIQIAAIDVTVGEIYVNPVANLSKEELRFVLAHEFLHAGLMHHERRQGRDRYLWNVACDYVINSWLYDMQIGIMPENGLLYDEKLKGMSAESIYDTIIEDLRRYSKLNTFRGYGMGDIMDNPGNGFPAAKNTSTSLDDFYKSALSQGLEYHMEHGRGYIPAGLIEEIRALSMPPIPWDVELAKWFDGFFAPLEKTRTYARPSRRQGPTPDIPRPSYTISEALLDGRTFGVVLDTSGSMDTKLIGKALGTIASYAASRDVPFARVIFCDAYAYDAGYLSPEEIAGRVKVKGRGGTVLQSGINALENSEDFPKSGPILIITDGECDEKLSIHREHAYLLPKGKRLPFRTKGKQFNIE